MYRSFLTGLRLPPEVSIQRMRAYMFRIADRFLNGKVNGGSVKTYVRIEIQEHRKVRGKRYWQLTIPLRGI
jgi:hypothetical protein